VIFKPEDPEVLVTPVAAIVILPVIAAATAAAIAAAWFALGQRATEYAGAGFDAFAVQTASGGSISPLYDDQGLDVSGEACARGKEEEYGQRDEVDGFAALGFGDGRTDYGA